MITRTGSVTTLAGSGGAGWADGLGPAASFYYPHGIVVDVNGDVFVGDSGNNQIRKVTSSGLVTTFAGYVTSTASRDGQGTSCGFSYPAGIAVDINGNLFVADWGNQKIRKVIISSGSVATLAGSGVYGLSDGSGTSAQFRTPASIVCTASGYFYVTDRDNHCIRIIDSTGIVSIFAGTGVPAWADGARTSASFNYPQGLTLDSFANIYVADMVNFRIRMIASSGIVSTLAGTQSAAWVDGQGTAAQFVYPTFLTVDSNLNVFVSDTSCHRIRRITSTGVVTTVAGSGYKNWQDGLGTLASFNQPNGIGHDSDGNLFVADMYNQCIRKIMDS